MQHVASDWELLLHFWGHCSPETVLAASLGPCTAGTEFPCACCGSRCQPVVWGE